MNGGGQSPAKRTIVAAATFTAEPIADAVRFWAAELDLPIDIRFAGYNQVFQELLDPSSLMSRNSSGLNVVALRLEDWGQGAHVPGRSEDLGSKVEDFIAAATSAADRLQAPLLIVVCPASSAVRNDDRELREADRAEAELLNGLAPLRGVHVTTADDLLARYQIEAYDDPGTEAHGHIPYTPAFFAALGTEIVRTLRAAEVPPPKVLVLDCDQTLWSGVVGEDGPLGVVIDPPRVALQEFALAQRRDGVLLCLCSKNAEEDVLAVLEGHPDMLLRREHFAAWRINWEAKSQNLRSLARELKVGVDTFVLVDDNPLECAEVSARCPEVVALTLPRAATEIPRFLSSIWAFDRLERTQEDSQRADFYRQSPAREALRTSSLTFADFVASLALEVRLFAPGPEHLARVAQLTQRTNQFNNTTIRRTEPEVRRDLASSEVQCIAFEVSDRFGDYGLVGAAFYETRADALWVDTILMSCRALGRGVEHRVLSWLGETALSRGLARVSIPFVATERNHPLLQFLREIGAQGEVTVPATDNGSGPAVFELDAGDASRVTYDPTRSEEELGPQDIPEETEPSAGRMSPFRLDTTRLSAIATTVDSAEQILARMSAAARRRPRAAPTEYVAPRSPIEETLADMWAEALHVDHVGVFDDFFELGGSSLQATILVNRLQKALGRSFESIIVFDVPTVAGFAERLERQPTAPRRASPPVGSPTGERRGPLSFAQQRLWFLDQFDPGNTVYNERRAIRLRGSLRVEALDGALNDVVARHESLRTTFRAIDGRAEQSVAPTDARPLPITDLTSLPATDRVHEATRLIALEADRPFDLATGPLFRAGVVRLDADDHVLWFVFHHIVADGSSVRILMQEIEALYHLRLGTGDMLPAVRMQYLEFASWQRELLESDALAGQKAYWQRQLADPPVLELPADHPRPPMMSYRGSSVPVVIPAELVRELRVIGQRQRATLFMTLMAAFHVLLARHTGQDDIVVGFPIANRQELEVEGLIGFLVNTLPLRVDLSGDPPFDEVLRRVRQRAIEAYTHQDVPFEQLVEDVVPERDLARTPIFQAMLALLDDPIGQVDLRGLSASPVDVPVSTTRFELVLNLEESEAGLRGALEYSTDLFDPETADRMVGHLLDAAPVSRR